MVSTERWQAAQRYERSYWAMRARQIASGASAQLGWYHWRAEQLVKFLQAAGAEHVLGDAAVIEVGGGPVGTAGFLPVREVLLVDPLEEYFAENPVLVAVRNPRARYLHGVGEQLPAQSSAFDLAVIDNCIDHVQDAAAVMQEIKRVLKPGGLVYLSVNSRSPFGFIVHRVLSRLLLDPGHPYTFTPRRVEALVRDGGFEVLKLEVGSYWSALGQDLRSLRPPAVVKGLLGISEFAVRVLARRLDH